MIIGTPQYPQSFSTMNNRTIDYTKSIIITLLFLISHFSVQSASITTVASGLWSSSGVWPYTVRTGTISTNVASKIVTGAGSNFLNEFSKGSYITNTSGTVIGQVDSITSSTRIVLVTNASSTNNSISYGIKGVGLIDDVRVAATTSLTADLRISCRSISILTSTNSNPTNLYIDSSITLSEKLTMVAPFSPPFLRVKIRSGTFTCSGVNMNANSTLKYDSIIIENGNMIINGNISNANANTNIIAITGTGSLRVTGNIGTPKLINSSTLSTVRFDGQGSVPLTNYNNLTLSGNNTFSMQSGTVVNGTFTIMDNFSLTGSSPSYGASAVLNYNSTTARTVSNIEWPLEFISGNVLVSNTGVISLNAAKKMSNTSSISIDVGANLNTQNYNLTIQGNLINNGTLQMGSSSVYLTGTGTQTITNVSISDSISIQKTSGSIIFSGNIQTNHFNVDANGANVYLGSSNIYISGNALKTGGTVYPENSTIYYNGTNQSTQLYNYHHVVFMGSGLKTISTINSSNYTLSVGGNFSISSGAHINTANGTLELNGTTQSYTDNNSTPDSLYNLSLYGGVKTLQSSLCIKNNLTIHSDSYLQLSSNITLSLNGNIDGSGTLAGGSCGNLNNASLIFQKNGTMGLVYLHSTQNEFNHITINNGANVSFESDVNIYGTLNLIDGILSIQKTITFHTADVPIIRTSGVLNMGSTSSLKFGGCTSSGAAFTLPDNLFYTSPVTLQHIIVNRNTSISIGNTPIHLTGVLTLSQGTFFTNNNLVLKSTASGTARIEPISDLALFSGTVTVERFIPGGSGKRKWRLLSFPVNIAGSLSLAQFKDDIFVTGPASTAGGFDASPTNSSSLRVYNESITGTQESSWVNPSTIYTTFPTGTGIEVFVRGSRLLENPYLNWTIPDDVTIDYGGFINQGSYTLALSYTNSSSSDDGFNLIGNPYPSPINFDTSTLTKTNMQNRFWSYNPNNSSYGIYDAELGIGTNGINKYIESGQAFFVKATASNASIRFTENVKCKQAGNFHFRSTGLVNTIPYIKIGISNDSLYNDECIIVLDPQSTVYATDTKDASKLFNDALNIYSLSKEKYNLNIDARPLPQTIDTVPLAVFSYNGADLLIGTHYIKANEISNIPASINLVLWDSYTNLYIDLKKESTYAFSISPDPNSWGKNRFKLLMGDVQLSNSSVEESEFIVYPNPTKDKLNIELQSYIKDQQLQFNLYDITGAIVKHEARTMNRDRVEILVTELPNGLYWLEIVSAKRVLKKKILKY